MDDPNEIENIPIADLKSEEGAEDLAGSVAMRPYLRPAQAVITQKGLKEAVAEIGQLPLEERYLWRVLSALKWGFADFDNVNVVIDRNSRGARLLQCAHRSPLEVTTRRRGRPSRMSILSIVPSLI